MPKPAPKKTSKKEKVRKKRGEAIAAQKKAARIRRSKEDRQARSAQAEEAAAKERDPLRRSITRDAEGEAAKRARKADFTTGRMDVDAFFEGGFMDTMREIEEEEEGEGGSAGEGGAVADGSEEEEEEEEEEGEGEEEEGSDDEEDGSDDGEEGSAEDEDAPQKPRGASSRHKHELEALEKSDPEFYKYLMQTDQKLLDFDAGGDSEEEEEDEDEEEQEGDEEGSDGGGGSDDDDGSVADRGRSERVREVVEVTAETVRGWQRTLERGEHTPTLRQLVAAFRCAAHYGDEDEAAEALTGVVYTFNSAHVFNLLMQFCLAKMDEVLRRHVAGGAATAQPAKGERRRGSRPDQQPHWKKHSPLVKSYVTQLIHFSAKLAEPDMLLMVLHQMHRLLPLVAVFPKLCPKVLRVLLRAWGDGLSQQCTLVAYAAVRQMAAELPPPFVDHCLKGLYLTYARGSARTSRASLQHVVLTSSCVVDLCALDAAVAYQHAFVYIRQLAIHLRNALQKPSAETYRQVYNWKFVNCLRLWAQVLCAQARDAKAPLRQLLYPLVQVCIGTARLLPNIRFAGLRFQCVRLLNQISAELGAFIPVAPLLLDAFGFAQLQKPPAGSGKERPHDWAVLIKVPNAEAQKRVYHEGMMTQGLFLLASHLHTWAYHIAFPELAAAPLLALKRLGKKTKIVSLQNRIRALAAQLDAQVAWVLRAREKVDFAPRDAEKVDAFLADEKEARAGPMSRWYAGELAAVEKAEAEWRAKAGAEGGVRADAEEEEEEEDEEEDEEGRGKKRRKHSKQEQAGRAGDAAAAARAPAPRQPRASAGEDDDVVDDLRLSDLDDDFE